MAAESSWTKVSEFSGSAQADDLAFRQLDDWLFRSCSDSQHFVLGSAGQAILVPLRSLIESACQLVAGATVSGLTIDDVQPTTKVLFVAAGTTDAAIDNLLITFWEGKFSTDWPGWVGVQEDPNFSQRFRLRLQRLGLQLPEAIGSIQLTAPGQPPSLWHIAPFPPRHALQGPLVPSGAKIPEGPDNLRGRAAWFQRRTGGPR
jgi:hypothetical protein